MSKKRVVVLGGGTGTFTVLSGLKHHDIDVTAVVSVADNGGSTGILRDELGVLPPGDIRQCLVALSADGDVLRSLFTYRFHEGSLAGHNFGNLFLSALEKVSGDPLSAIREAQRILQIKGRVIPVSGRASNLFAELEDGSLVEGEHAIDETEEGRSPIQRCFLSPSVPANPEALKAIEEADLLVLGPGDLYTSLIPVLLVDGVAKTIASSHGKRVFITNLVTKQGQTDGFSAKTFCDVVLRHIFPGTIDIVLLNSSTPSASVVERYEKQGEHLVVDDLRETPFEVRRAPLLAQQIVEPKPGDVLRRSFLRHDSQKLATAIVGCL